ncbi:MAG: hypothetical protein MAG451_01846 [Anaerolineales bacterium]|nr:hypothetical protein [Anaerolineales bacterium]
MEHPLDTRSTSPFVKACPEFIEGLRTSFRATRDASRDTS